MRDDADLADLAAIARGDERALRALHARHATKVFRFVLRLVRNEAVAEEVTNEAFVEIWKGAGRFRGGSAVGTWLISVARNKAIDRLRKRGEEPLDEEAAARLPDGADDPEMELAKRDKGALMRRVIEGLSPVHREIVDLVYYQEQSVAEAAAVLGVPENTVKTRMFYARKQLARLFAEAGIDRGWP
ncbi:sigma-70 family RNA polymerase sigma factor [Salinarimonas rosea]|uniref:sigma-70 family RNA polymerase sigma factor n=1 Tax=Salinarimonas rosea TaxID=552063 RepID=UPI00041D2D0E|nr:sigma-70 family RNA polymerase sigma factor [Salinarimonas rosea]